MKDKTKNARVAQLPERFRMAELMKKHGHTDKATGYFAYDPEWSDARVAAEATAKGLPALGVLHAVSVRKGMGFGRLIAPKGGRKDGSSPADLMMLAQALRQLYEELGQTPPAELLNFTNGGAS